MSEWTNMAVMLRKLFLFRNNYGLIRISPGIYGSSYGWRHALKYWDI